MASKLIIFCLIFIIGSSPSQAFDPLINVKDICIRDPFIYTDKKNNHYLMYAQTANRNGSDFIGVEVYTSKDLENWKQPKPVLILPETEGIRSVWAPEMHEYQGKFYLFVTLTYKEKLPRVKPVDKRTWPEMYIRGTHVFHSDSPYGPFKLFKSTSFTPKDWMALDGTLYVEESTPYMIFCHEWVQLIDGTMDYVQLKDDLSDTVGNTRLMFSASDAPGAISDPQDGKVTDGCFLYKSPKSQKLFMIWSTFIPGDGYCVFVTFSESGKISGPWQKHMPIYTQNGGHGMIFRTLGDKLVLALHQPNSTNLERLHLFEIIDTGDILKVGDEINSK